MMGDDGLVDALIVGAGPTGLALAAQLRAFGTRFRIVDRALDRAHESRALAVQARPLELLQAIGLADELVARGNRSGRLMIHLEGRLAADAPLGGFQRSDTRFPFILFVSQAETEALLGEHLASRGVTIERGVELADFAADDAGVTCTLVHPGGRHERVRTRFLAGCDGAHSAVRKRAGIPYEGGAYPQDFALGDVEADAIPERDAIHPFVGGRGVAMFFPLGRPTTWRVIAMAAADPERGSSAPPARDEPLQLGDLSLAELQRLVDRATGGAVRLRDPAWLTHFRLHHRQAARYAVGRVFLAGDAAHIHSPVGAQGMNTGIQDAWNLGWKLALVARGAADPRLLESYEAERWPVGHLLLRTTDRAFSAFTRAMTPSPAAAWLRREVVARVLPRVLLSRRLRAYAFRFISELGIHYRRSQWVAEGTPPLTAGPRAGDRLPDARLARDGRETYLQRELAGPRYQLLLCGPPGACDGARVMALKARYGALLAVEHLTPDPAPGVLVDADGETLRRLGVKYSAQYLVRPDGYVAFRCAGSDTTATEAYLQRYLASV